MAKVLIEGNELELPDDICADNKSLLDALVSFYPAAGNASVQRKKEGDTTIITVTKRAGSKGLLETVVRALKEAPETINPILVIETTGWKKHTNAEIDEALLTMVADQEEITRITRSLGESAPEAAQTVPVGF